MQKRRLGKSGLEENLGPPEVKLTSADLREIDSVFQDHSERGLVPGRTYDTDRPLSGKISLFRNGSTARPLTLWKTSSTNNTKADQHRNETIGG
jgi:hypothetical protein